MSTRNVKLPVLLVAALLAAACATHPPAEVELPADEPEIVYVPEYPEPEPEPPEPSFVDYWLAKLTLEEKIGQLLMPRLPFGTTALNAAARQMLDDIPVGGIILFADNVSSVAQVQALTRDLQETARLPLFISVDEEGGRVSRVGRLFGSPTAAAYDIGRRGDSEGAREAARTIGQRLALLGINMNFAPVADIWSNPANTVIGTRAFGRDAGVVGDMVEAAVWGFADEGVMSVVKHFPGHGDTYQDSHFLLAIHPHGRERFDLMEALPFARGIQAGADGVMIAHVATPAIEGSRPLLDWMAPWIESGNLPATLSDFWLQDVLRGEMGFDGLIITDALEMRALTDHFTCAQIALGAFLAGADILLMPASLDQAFQALLDGYHYGLFDERRLHESLRRILRAKEALVAHEEDEEGAPR